MICIIIGLIIIELYKVDFGWRVARQKRRRAAILARKALIFTTDCMQADKAQY
jgi:hypothetical protein